MRTSTTTTINRNHHVHHHRNNNISRKADAQRSAWAELLVGADKLAARSAGSSQVAFAFQEGMLVRAYRDGAWVLLDEINLASAETLQRLSGLLEGQGASLRLVERGDSRPLQRHPAFRVFATMNPPTDAGKKDLPAALR